MSLLKSLTTDDSIANEKDSLGGGVLNSDVYPATIKLAYVKKASSGALALALHAQTADGRKIQEDLWMTSGTAKGGKNYYERDGQKFYLPGYLTATSITLLTIGKEISDVDTEEKVVSIYSPEAKAEVPTKADVLTDLIGKEVILGVLKQVVDKQVKGADGSYTTTGETREVNTINKVFRATDQMTTFEIRNKAEEPAFYAQWKERWQGKVDNRASKNSGGSAGSGPAASVATKKPTASLFGS